MLALNVLAPGLLVSCLRLDKGGHQAHTQSDHTAQRLLTQSCECQLLLLACDEPPKNNSSAMGEWTCLHLVPGHADGLVDDN